MRLEIKSPHFPAVIISTQTVGTRVGAIHVGWFEKDYAIEVNSHLRHLKKELHQMQVRILFHPSSV